MCLGQQWTTAQVPGLYCLFGRPTLSSWLLAWPDPAFNVVAIWRMSKQTEDVSLSLVLCQSAFQMIILTTLIRIEYSHYPGFTCQNPLSVIIQNHKGYETRGQVIEMFRFPFSPKQVQKWKDFENTVTAVYSLPWTRAVGANVLVKMRVAHNCSRTEGLAGSPEGCRTLRKQWFHLVSMPLSPSRWQYASRKGYFFLILQMAASGLAAPLTEKTADLSLGGEIGTKPLRYFILKIPNLTLSRSTMKMYSF